MFWNTISVLITSIIAFTLTPYVTRNIGIEATGFISLSNTIVSYIDIIVIALNAFASRNIAIAYHNGNHEEVEIYYSSVLIANAFLSCVINLLCIFMVINIQSLLNVSDYLLNDVQILLYIMIVNYTINIFGSIFSISAFITNRSSITYRNKGISSILYAITLFLMIYFNSVHVYYVAIGYLVAAIFSCVSNFYYTKKILPDLKLDIRLFSFRKIRILISSGIWNSISNIGSMLNSGLDLIVSNKMLSTVVMGQISISKQLSSIMTTFTGIIVNSFQPKQLERYAKGDIKGLVKYLKLSINLSSILTITLFAVFFVLGKSFLSLWIPGQDIDYIYKLCIIVIFGDIVVATVRPLYYVFTLTDKLRITCVFTVASGIINFISMILLLSFSNLGGYAVVGTTCVLNFITNLVLTPYLAGKFLKLRKNPFFRILAKHLFVCFIITIILSVINSYFVITSWFGLVVSGGINGLFCIAFSALLMISGNNQKEIINHFLHKGEKCNERKKL